MPPSTHRNPVDGPNDGFVVANNEWYKQWFINETPTLDLLGDFRGHISLHYGEIDRQVSVQREAEYIDQCARKMNSQPKLVVHKSCGHALALSKPVTGPMDQHAENELVRDLTAMFQFV